MPVNATPSKQIHVMRVVHDEEKETLNAQKQTISEKLNLNDSEKAYSIDEIRTKHKDAYKPWTQELDDELTIMYCEGVNIKDMAKHFGRTRGAIRSRIRKLELEELYG